jgi:glycosyltransferase involved in cell wall biosynthesis
LVPPTRRPLVITVHDVAAIVHPNLHPAHQGGLVQLVVAALPRAAAVVAVSRATADDLLELGVDSERLFVAPLGLTSLPEAEPLPAETPAPGTYLLTVGETSPRKGYDVMLQALSQVDPGPSLVIAGPPAGDETRLQALVSGLGLEARVVRLRSVSDGELASLYQGAVALCFPSIAEGFGLPVLEAMAAGLPVIASALPIIRELAVDAAVFVERRDPALWAQAIRSLMSEPATRSELAKAGRERARAFSWETTAAITEEAYKFALSSRAGPFESARSPSSSAS